MRTAIKPLLVTSLLALSIKIAIAETPPSIDCWPPLMVENYQQPFMWEAVPYPMDTGTMPTMPFNSGFNPDFIQMPAPAVPMHNGFPPLDMSNQGAIPFQMPMMQQPMPMAQQNFAPMPEVPMNNFAPPMMQAPIQQPLYMPPPAPFYMMEMPAMPMVMPEIAPLPTPATPDPALGNENKELKEKLSAAEESHKKALSDKDALIATLKDTIKGDLSTLKNLSNERDQLEKRIIELETQLTANTKSHNGLRDKIHAFTGLSDKESTISVCNSLAKVS